MARGRSQRSGATGGAVVWRDNQLGTSDESELGGHGYVNGAPMRGHELGARTRSPSKPTSRRRTDTWAAPQRPSCGHARVKRAVQWAQQRRIAHQCGIT